MAANILVVDDEEDIRLSIEAALKTDNYSVQTAATGEEAIEKIDGSDVDIVLLDLNLPGLSGREVLDRVARGGGPLVMVVTAQSDVKVAVDCIRAGAYDFMVKPFSLDEVRLAVRRLAEHAKVREQMELMNLGRGDRFAEMIGSGPAIKKVFELVRRAAAATRTTVLITGESGTGKELVARAVHRESERVRAPFIAVNCTAVQETLLESEFFGHERGAFTDARESKKGLLEVADGGTILLDEIGDMTEKLQAKLLRFLEDRSFRRLGGTQTLYSDVRIIAATNRDLEKAVSEGAFREDLFYRLNVLPIAVPPLRERSQDIPLLANCFIEDFCRDMGVKPKRFTPAALDAMKGYSWPGNIRELKNVVERIVILEDVEEVDARNLPPEIVPDRDFDAGAFDEPLSALPYSEAKQLYLNSFTRDYVSNLLGEHDGNVTRSAKKAKMDRANFQRLMRKVGLSADEYGKDKGAGND